MESNIISNWVVNGIEFQKEDGITANISLE